VSEVEQEQDRQEFEKASNSPSWGAQRPNLGGFGDFLLAVEEDIGEAANHYQDDKKDDDDHSCAVEDGFTTRGPSSAIAIRDHTTTITSSNMAASVVTNVRLVSL
jgi:hypothetical protein